MMATQQHLDGLPPQPGMQQDHTGQYQQIPQDPNNIHGLPGAEVQMDGEDHPNAVKTDGAAKDGTPKSKDKRERLRSRACVACHTGKTRCSDTLPCQSCIKRGISNTCAYPDPMDTAQNNTTTNNADSTAAPSTSGSRRKSNQNQAQQAGQNVFSTGPHVRAFYYDQTVAPGAPQQQQQQTGVSAYPNGAASVIGPAAAIAASNAAMGRRDDSPGGGRPTKKARYRNLTDSEMASFQQPSPQQLNAAASSSTKAFKRGSFYIGDSAPVTVDHRLPLRILLADDQNVDFFVGAGIEALPP